MEERRLMTLITDCRDDNALARVTARLSSLLPIVPNKSIGVTNDLEAGLNIVDQLDALDGKPGIILVNVAPRNGHAKKWENGTPFGWIQVENTYIFGTIGDYTFSLLEKILARKLTVNVFDLPQAVLHFGLSEEREKYIISTQFRSFEFLPRAAAMIVKRMGVPTEEWNEIPAVPSVVVWVDCFGNIKTSVLPEEIGFAAGKNAALKAKGLTKWLECYNRLKDIPDNSSGVIIGSSGMWVGDTNKRFLEIVINGGSAAALYKHKSGDRIEMYLY